MVHEARNKRISTFYNKTLLIDDGDNFCRFAAFQINYYAQTRTLTADELEINYNVIQKNISENRKISGARA